MRIEQNKQIKTENEKKQKIDKKKDIISVNNKKLFQITLIRYLLGLK